MTVTLSGKLCSLLAILVVTTTAGFAQSVSTRHVRDIVSNGDVSPVGRLPQNQVLQLDIVLPLRDPVGLQRFLADIYNPTSPHYLQFVTPGEFTARFGPTVEQYERVLSFARSNGLIAVGGSRDGMDVQVTGTVTAIETAFRVIMYTYPHPTENRLFYSADREPAHDLPFNLWHVSGLDNYSTPKSNLVNKSEYAAAHGLRPEQLVTEATTGSGPSAAFLGSDMRAAYYGGTALTGAGQHLGLFQFLGVDLADLNTYYANVHQTNSVPINLISTDGTSTSCVYPACDDGEQTFDMTQALGMAPGLASLDVYIGTLDTAILSAMTTHNPLPFTISSSWSWGPADPATDDPYFQKMAAQGQTFFVASGDSSTWVSTGFYFPQSDAYVVSVGGTDLSTASAGGAWASETAWSASGGGISPVATPIPAWQQLSGVINSSNYGSTTLRNGPDVSANANWSFYSCIDQQACQSNVWGGTSFAAPMWAGFMALVNQQRATNGQSAVGFINPVIYSQNITSSYATNFHDISSGTSGSYSAVAGFDLVTGWGSPQPALIAALAGISAAKTPQTITFGAAPVLTVGGTGALSATASSGLAVTFTSTTTSICTVSGSTVSGVAAGSCVVAANQAGNATYAAAPQVTQTITVGKGSQTITFGAAPAVTAGGTGTLSATASSGLAVTFVSTTTSICTVSGSTVSGVAAGSCVVAANQAGNATYAAAPQVTQTITVGKGSQTITFGAAPAVTVGGTGTLSATASSGLAVTFASTTTSICTVSGSTVTGVAAGTCTITANQPGNTNYNAAAQVTQNITVTAKKSQTITFGPTPVENSCGTGTLSASASSGLPVAFTSATPSACTVSGNSVTAIANGVCTVAANQAGNATYAAAAQVTQSFVAQRRICKR